MKRARGPAAWLLYTGPAPSRPVTARGSAPGDARSSHDQGGTPPARRGGLLVQVAEYFSLATAVSFFLAIWANQLVFGRWGLSFVQLATITDVLMSGLSLLGALIPFMVVFAVGFQLGGRRSRLQWLWYGYLALGLSMTGFGIVVAVLYGRMAPAIAVGGVALAGLFTPSVLRLRRRRTLAGRLSLAAWAAALSVCVLVVAEDVTDDLSRAGYSAEPLHLVRPEGVGGCVGHMLWAGERVIVLDCDDKLGDHDDLVVVFGQENRTFERHHPLARQKTRTVGR